MDTIKESFRNKVWKSTVQLEFVYAEIICTAIIVDKTDEFIYILLNLHSLVDDELTEHVSNEFQKEIKKFTRYGHSSKKRIRKVDDSRVKRVEQFDPRNVKVFFLNTDSKKIDLEMEFILEPECCLISDSKSDFAILKVPCKKTTLESCELSQNPTAYNVCDSMNVHVFGFPGALKDFKHGYTVNSMTISGFDSDFRVVITGLSSPGLSGSAIVCTVRGWPIGYLGGELTSGETKNSQYQAYGYLLTGIMKLLFGTLPRFNSRT